MTIDQLTMEHAIHNLQAHLLGIGSNKIFALYQNQLYELHNQRYEPCHTK